MRMPQMRGRRNRSASPEPVHEQSALGLDSDALPQPVLPTTLRNAMARSRFSADSDIFVTVVSPSTLSCLVRRRRGPAYGVLSPATRPVKYQVPELGQLLNFIYDSVVQIHSDRYFIPSANYAGCKGSKPRAQDPPSCLLSNL